MRIFEKDGKTNFVDTQDVYVGLDAYQSCCESFGHYFSHGATKEDEEIETPENLEEMIFDVEFFEERDGHDQGGEAVFRLFNPHQVEPVIYLVLFNHHNGYYSHGFEMQVGGTVVQSGAL